MRFEDFDKSRDVKKSAININLAKSLIKTSEKDIAFLKMLEINENSARKIMTNYYDILRSILEAMAAIDGYKIYSHEAFTYFLKEKSETLAAEKFDRFRKIRNSINYYGADISPAESKENIVEIIKLVKQLKDKYLKDYQ